MSIIYHMAERADWVAAEAAGAYGGGAQDRSDGFIHFSTGAQIVESARRHRAGAANLVLLEVEAAALGAALRWEASRGGEPFPHLYGPLPVAAVRAVHDLPLGADGLHVFPPLNA